MARGPKAPFQSLLFGEPLHAVWEGTESMWLAAESEGQRDGFFYISDNETHWPEISAAELTNIIRR
jgi:hypothetical protein